ncbi:MAG: metallophosphoesterase, partial [Deltaproteobacteria bacterium]|nr:metallophosphoesterase [Deltaproteobacteria bacterium]
MSIPKFFLYIIIFFLSGQALALWICWRRLRGRPGWRWAAVIGFILVNAPWFILAKTLTATELPASWLFAYIVRPFTSWQILTWLWLIGASLLGIMIYLLYHLPKSIFLAWHRPRSGYLLAGIGPSSTRTEPKENLTIDRGLDGDKAPSDLVGRPAIEINNDHDSNPPSATRRRQLVLPVNPSRRQFLARTARGAAWAGAIAAGGWGLFNTLLPPKIVRYDLTFPNLPKELIGLTVAHLSDLHVGGWTTSDEIAQALDLTRALKPDLVVITGDLIDRNPNFSQALVRHLPLLAGVPLGVFAIIGNHDIYTGASMITAALNNHGLVMLRDKSRSFQADGLPLALVGMDDSGSPWTGAGGQLGVSHVAAGLPERFFTILLTHRPTNFPEARAAGIPLTLCGHTHGGQFGIPGG